MSRDVEESGTAAKGKWRPLRFAVVGVANTVVDFGTFNLLLYLGMNRVPANVIAIGLAMVCSYFMNSRWAFRSNGSPVAFFAVTATGMGLNTLFVALLGGIPVPGLPYASVLVPNASKVAASAVSLVWNYLGYARWVFREPATGIEGPQESDGR